MSTDRDDTSGAPSALPKLQPLETAIERVLQEARIAKMSERDPHYRYLLTILALSNRTQGLAHALMQSAESYRQTIEQAKTELVALRTHRIAEAPPVDANRSDADAIVGRLRTPLAYAALLCFAVVIVGIYRLGEHGALGSRDTVTDHLRQAYGLDEPSARAWSEVIPLNDLRQVLARCRELHYYYENGGRYCDLRLYVPTPPGKQGR